MVEINLVWKIFLENISNDSTENRNNLRKIILNEFLKENPWTWIWKLVSKYLYIVEKLNNWWKICLRRPANLKNGFDFLILYPDSNINKWSRLKDAPSFDNILKIIQENIKNIDFKNSFLEKIKLIYECKNIDNFYSNEEEIILKISKWLFIEQDIRYWNYSGRDKFYLEIQKIK